MSFLVVKGCGSGNIVETPTRHAIPWLAYRRLRFDHEHVTALLCGVEKASARRRIVLVPGGMGAYLFIDLAQQLGAHDDGLRDIACRVIDTTGRVLIAGLRYLGVEVCDEPVSDLCLLEGVLKQTRVVVLGPSLAYRSTDSLAAAAAAVLPAARLILFKAGVPEYHVGFKRPTIVKEFTTSQLASIAREFHDRPGHNAILDPECVSIIARHAIDTWLVNKEQASKLDAVGDAPESMHSTSIRVG